jgi:hypothetical protein
VGDAIGAEAAAGGNPPPAEDDTGQLHIIDLRDVPSRWPTLEGMVSPAPDAWRWHDRPDVLAVVDAFYRDLLWNIQLEVDGVTWPGRATRAEVSILAACRDVARLWHLPSSEETLPAPSRRRPTKRR